MFKRGKQKGFTLIELMIVIAIVGILAAVCIPVYISYVQKSRIRSLVYPGLHIIETNISLYYASMGRMPAETDLPAMTLEASTRYFNVSMNGNDLVVTIDSPARTSKLSRMHGKVMLLTPDTYGLKIRTWTVRGSLADYLGINTE